jgi:hypothetical protein
MAAVDTDFGFTIPNAGPNRHIRLYPIEETTPRDLTEVDEALDPFWDEDGKIEDVP